MTNTLQTIQSTLPTATEWDTIMGIAKVLVASKLLPETIKTAEAAATIILKGREMDIPAMQAFSHIYVLKGKPTCSAELQLSLLARGGVTWEWTADGSDGQAEIVFSRPGFKPCHARFSLEDAKTAGLTRNPTWTNYPAAMLRARAISIGARMIGPDMLCGMSYPPEEMGADVNEDGIPVEPVAVAVTPIDKLNPKAGDTSGPFKVVDVPDDAPGLDSLANQAHEPGTHEEEVAPPPHSDQGSSDYFLYLEYCQDKKKALGEDAYYEVLAGLKLKKSNEVGRGATERQRQVMKALLAKHRELETAAAA